jgi:membrane fusion protein (multidrug efflux system)
MSATFWGRERALGATRAGLKFRRKSLAILALLALAGAGGARYGSDWWTTGRFIETTDDAYVGGNVTAISPYVAGFVSRVLVADNERVQPGQLLVQLDQRDLQIALDRTQAVVDARTAALAGLRAQYLLQQTVIQQFMADYAAKIARAAFAQIEGARYASLAMTAAGSRQTAEKTQAAEQEAKAASAAAQAALDASHQQLKVLEAQIIEAQAVVDEAQSDLRAASLNLGYTDVRSPIDGFVGNRTAQAGAYASRGSYLLSVIPAQGLWVEANFKEDQLAHMMPGQAATIVVDVAPGKRLKGRVLSVAPATGAIFSVIPAENATGNFTKIVQRVPVRIELDASDPLVSKLRPGLSAIVSVNTRDAP